MREVSHWNLPTFSCCTHKVTAATETIAGTWYRYKLASTAASAISISGIISQFMFIVIVPFARPDYWRDRIGGRPLLIWVNLMGFPLIGCYIYWYVTPLPLLLLLLLLPS